MRRRETAGGQKKKGRRRTLGKEDESSDEYRDEAPALAVVAGSLTLRCDDGCTRREERSEKKGSPDAGGLVGEASF